MIESTVQADATLPSELYIGSGEVPMRGAAQRIERALEGALERGLSPDCPPELARATADSRLFEAEAERELWEATADAEEHVIRQLVAERDARQQVAVVLVAREPLERRSGIALDDGRTGRREVGLLVAQSAYDTQATHFGPCHYIGGQHVLVDAPVFA